MPLDGRCASRISCAWNENGARGPVGYQPTTMPLASISADFLSIFVLNIPRFFFQHRYETNPYNDLEAMLNEGRYQKQFLNLFQNWSF